MQVNFNVDKDDWQQFKIVVGENNASSTIRNFIKSYAVEKPNIGEVRLKKEFQLVEEDYLDIKKKRDAMKSKIDKIELERKQKELEDMKKEEEQKKRKQHAVYEAVKDNLHRAV